jgi:hypothetical protein
VHNLDKTNKPNNADDNSTSEVDSEDGPKNKPARTIHTTTKREGLHRKYYQYCKKFADMMKKEGTEATLDEWEKLYGPTATLKKSKMKKAPDRPTTNYSAGKPRQKPSGK